MSLNSDGEKSFSRNGTEMNIWGVAIALTMLLCITVFGINKCQTIHYFCPSPYLISLSNMHADIKLVNF